MSDINVKYTGWVLDDKISEITKGSYSPGIHTIQFSTPVSQVTTNAGQIIKQMPYYVILEIQSNAKTEVVLSGRKYVSQEMLVSSSIEHVKAGEARSAKTFSGTLLNFDSAQAVAENILEYYQFQQIIQTKHLSSTEKSGDWVEIENVSRSYGNFLAMVESLSIDLVNGFIGSATCRGYYKLVSDYYYAGNELWSGEEVGVI